MLSDKCAERCHAGRVGPVGRRDIPLVRIRPYPRDRERRAITGAERSRFAVARAARHLSF